LGSFLANDDFFGIVSNRVEVIKLKIILAKNKIENVIITGASGGWENVALHCRNGWNVIATMLCLEHGKNCKDKEHFVFDGCNFNSQYYSC
jgi:hypothetical protein